MAIKATYFNYKTNYEFATFTDLPEYACLQHYGYSAYPEIRHKTFDNDGADGLIYTGKLFKERRFSLPIVITPYSTLNTKQTIRKFAEEFLVFFEDEGVLIFNDEPTRMYITRLESMEVNEFYNTGATITVNLVCTYPFAIHKNYTSASSILGASSFTARNDGTAPMYAWWDISAYSGSGVVRPKVTNSSTGKFFGYNTTIGTSFFQRIEVDCWKKTVEYNGMNRSAYFMPRGTFFELEPDSVTTIQVSCDSGLSDLAVSMYAYIPFLI